MPDSAGARDVLQRPTEGRISSHFGWRTIRGVANFHSGNDYRARRGAPVNASAPGTVISVGMINRYGIAIVLRHEATPAPLYTLYGHLERALVPEGAIVNAGQQIATVGDTAGTRDDPNARTEAPHLHHELLTRWPPRGIDQDRIDPAPYLTPYERDATATTRAAVGSGAILLLAGLYWYTRRSKKTRRPGVHPAAAGPTDASGSQWPA